MLLIILGIVLFVLLVIVHEFGHFFAARRNGVEVEEFGIFFPPRLWKTRLKNKTLLTINLLPLGGFVKLKGEHDADKKPGAYGAASLWVKTKIIMAGVFVNLVVAVLLFTLLALIGMPKIVDNQFAITSDTKVVRSDVLVGFVEPDSPAEKAGIKTYDKLVSISNQDGNTQIIYGSNVLPDITQVFAGQKVIVAIERDGKPLNIEATLRTTQEVNADQNKGYLGVIPTEYTLQRSTWSAPIVGIGITKQFAELTYKGIASVIAGLFRGDGKQASEQISGPVGIFALIKRGSSLGVQFILMITAVISLTLAIMNALPIPALDGGRLFVTYLYRLLRKPLTPQIEDRIHGIGFATLMLLFVVITVIDIRRFF